MARSPRTAPAAADHNHQHQHPLGTPNAIASSSKVAPVRKSARRQSVSSSATAPSTPFTPGPLTPATDPSTPLPISAPVKPTPRGTVVEPKTHALRNLGGNGDRTAIPFPEQYGGKDKCGVDAEDEADEALMAACAACASLGNRALSPEELAAVSIAEGWLRQPSAAIEPSTIVSTAIRAHLKRCEKATPPRQPLLGKHQLAGSVNESVLERALYPGVFSTGVRPKGTVFYLLTVGKTKWKNPFDGIDIPKPPPRKPAQPKKKREIKPKKEVKEKVPSVPKIRLVLKPQPDGEGEVSDVGSSSRSASGPRSRSGSAAPSVPASRASRRPSVLDSSDESDSSESETEAHPLKPRPRKGPPAPIAISASPRMTHLGFPRHQASPLRDLFFPASQAATAPSAAPPHSPFPTHSLDNTFWAARGDEDRFASLETSSSSSDEEIRDPEWGNTSGILIRGADGDDQPMWTAEDEETNVKEATDALRVLFPMSSPEEEKDDKAAFELPLLDSQPAPSESGSIADSAHTLVAQAISRGQLKSLDASGSVVLNPWTENSSPIASPSLRTTQLPIPDSSPTQHLSKLRSSFDPEAMEIDEEPWLDETGELPVRAEDSFSDIDLGSTIGDSATPERDRQLHTAEWAREAAATSFRVKEEPEDYPSPVTTEGDDAYHRSRSSSTPSHTPSSRSSELPAFEFDPESMGLRYIDEVIAGPESISMDEIDGWMLSQRKTEKTPQRRNKPRCQSARCSGTWGGIGVGAMLSISPPIKSKAKGGLRSSRRKSSPCAVKFELPPYETRSHRHTVPEVESDAIGTDDLERARAEADEREEQRRKQNKEREESQKALLEAYRLKVSENTDVDMWDLATPSWTGDTAWGSGSVDSLAPSALSPMMLHSVSALSLSDLPSAVDPKALLSPPLVQIPTPERQISPVPMPAPLPPAATAPASAPASLAVPTAVTTDASPKSSESDLTPLTSGSASPAIASPNPNVEPPTPAPSAKIDSSVHYEIRTGVYAMVRDNIPVYQFTKVRENAEDVVILRRLDSDFVNIESILISYNVDPSIITKHMKNTSEETSRRCPVASPAGIPHAPGVPGFWISLDLARQIVQAIDAPILAAVDVGLGALLSPGLFDDFKKKTRIKAELHICDKFGADFIAGALPPKSASGLTKAAANNARAPGKKAAPAGLTSGPNSKSTPNLTALGTSAPGPPAATARPPAAPAVQAKGPLVRAAPATPPDGCPGPKRRRATVVGQSPLKPVPIPAGGATAPAAPPATRAGTSLPAPKTIPAPRPGAPVPRPGAAPATKSAPPTVARPVVKPAPTATLSPASSASPATPTANSTPKPPPIKPAPAPAATPKPASSGAATPSPAPVSASAAARTLNAVKKHIVAAAAAAHSNVTGRPSTPAKPAQAPLPAPVVAAAAAPTPVATRRMTRTTDPSPVK